MDYAERTINNDDRPYRTRYNGVADDNYPGRFLSDDYAKPAAPAEPAEGGGTEGGSTEGGSTPDPNA